LEKDSKNPITREVNPIEKHARFIFKQIISTRQLIIFIMSEHVARKEKRNAYRVLLEKPERKKPLVRPRPGGRIVLGLSLEK
jgi:hypothetical protein